MLSNRLKLLLLFVFSGLIDKRCLEFKHLTEIDKCMIFEFRNLYLAIHHQRLGSITYEPLKTHRTLLAEEHFERAVQYDDDLVTLDLSNFANFNLKNGIADIILCS